MSGYMIFAIVLTVGYIIYYGVVLGRDLYGKKTYGDSDNVEEFNVTPSDPVEDVEEAATVVMESANGFSVGDNVYEQALMTAEVDTEMSSSKDSKAQAKVEMVTSGMEVTRGQGEVEMDSEQMEELMKNADMSKLFKPEMSVTRTAV